MLLVIFGVVSFLLILCWVQCADLEKLLFCCFVEGSFDQAVSTKQVERHLQGLLHSSYKYYILPSALLLRIRIKA